MTSLSSKFLIPFLIFCLFFGCGTDEEEPDGRFPLITLKKLHSEGDYVWFELNADPAPEKELHVLIESYSVENPETGYTWLRVGKSVKQVEFGLSLSSGTTWNASVVPLSVANVNAYPLQGTEAAGASEFPKYYAAAPSTRTADAGSPSKRKHRKPVYLDFTPPPPDPNASEGMVGIPVGEFRMGSTVIENEKPVHTVYLDAFYIDRYEVTNAEYKKFVDANPIFRKTNFPADFHDGNYLAHWTEDTYPSGQEHHPVTYVSWYAAMAYARWAGKRLPTESEWEKAARGGLPGVKYPWGNTATPGTANAAGVSGSTLPIGSYPPNRYGLHDMAGNVHEWCLDAYDAAFYEASPREHPIAGAATISEVLGVYFTDVASDRVLRGGSWQSSVETLRVAARHGALSPKAATAQVGFRCARRVDAPVDAPVTLQTALPAGSTIDSDAPLTFTFDATPKNVSVNTGTVETLGKDVSVTGPFDPGKLALVLRWGDGLQLLSYDVRHSVRYVSASPRVGSTIESNDTLTFSFDGTPEGVKVNKGTASASGNTVTITGPFTPGTLNLQVTWKDGSQILQYTVRKLIAYTSVNPVAGSTIETDATLTLRFDGTPSDVKVNNGTASASGNTVTITGPFTPGTLNLQVTWKDGSQTLQYTVRKLIAYTSVNPVAGSTIETDATLTLRFDGTPSDVKVNNGTASASGNTVTITGPFTPGTLNLQVTWKDGSQILQYTVRKPIAYTSVNPVAGSIIETDATLTLRFDGTPLDVKVSNGTASASGNTVTITGPFTPGTLNLQVTWKDGSQILQYTVRKPGTSVSVDPVAGSIIETDATLTLQFDKTPEDVAVNEGTVNVSGNTLTITGPFTPGTLRLEVTWRDGKKTLQYTVRKPIAYTSVNPVAGSTIETDATLTLRFDGTPSDVKVNNGTARISGNTLTITGPFTPGTLRLEVTWRDGKKTLQYTVRKPIVYTSVNPVVGSTIETDATLTLRFDGTPSDVKVNNGTARISGNTLTITGPFTPGTLRLEVTWRDGKKTLQYTVRKPIAYTSVNPVAGSTIETDATLTLRFDGTPSDVKVNNGTARTSGNTLTITGPFTPGTLRLEVTWRDGKKTLQYTVQESVRFVEVINAHDKITGPWLWMIAPTRFGQGGAAATDVDSLAEASGGNVTEEMVAVNGANEGDKVGNLEWTFGEIAETGSDNVNDVVTKIGLGAGDINDHSSYALITLESDFNQNGVDMRVGSDDSVKVWLNGAVVHRNAVDRGASDFQDRFQVDLKRGDNLLLVKVSERGGGWSMFVGVDTHVNAVHKPAIYTVPIPDTDPVRKQPNTVDNGLAIGEVLIYTGEVWWITQDEAVTEAKTTQRLLKAEDIQTEITNSENAVKQWMLRTTLDDSVDVLILYGDIPSTIYPAGNALPDGSVAENWIETADGNTILNHADYIFYGNGKNGEQGLQNIMDIPGIMMWGDDTPMRVAASGKALTPSLTAFQSDRPFHLDELRGDWFAEVVFASNTGDERATRADPVIVRDGNRGRIAIVHQTSSENNPKGQVAAEIIINYLQNNQ